jgi:hypothetical protein
VYKLKRNETREIVKHKVKLVARGFVQQEGIDFDEVFAPVARMEFVRLLALAAQEGWQVHYMDVKSALLNGDLKEEVYVGQPAGFVIAGQEGKVLRLRKALYGLRQAPRAWKEFKARRHTEEDGFRSKRARARDVQAATATTSYLSGCTWTIW